MHAGVHRGQHGHRAVAVELRLIRVAVRRRRRRSRQFTLGLQVRVSFNYVLERLYTQCYGQFN